MWNTFRSHLLKNVYWCNFPGESANRPSVLFKSYWALLRDTFPFPVSVEPCFLEFTYILVSILLKFLQNWSWRKGRETCSLSFVQVLVLISILAPHSDWGTSLNSQLPQSPAGCCGPGIVFSLELPFAPETPIFSCVLGMGYWIHDTFTSNWMHHLLSQTSLFCGCALPHHPSQKRGHIRFIPYFAHPPHTKSF